MLGYAHRYKAELEELYQTKVLGNDYYKYWMFGSYWDLELDKGSESSEWSYIRRVSLSKEGKVIAYFKANIQRPENRADSFSILSLDNSNGILLLKDLNQFIDELFMKHQMYKISFVVVKNNPAKKIYDKFIAKANGRVVGVREKDVLLTDNKFYDVIMYEVMRENYIMSKENNIDEY